MHELAPGAIGLRFRFAHSAQKACIEDRSLIVSAVELGPMLVAPMHTQDFLQRVTRRLAAGAVRRRQVGSVIHVAHEIDPSASPIALRGREQLPCRSETRGDAPGRSGQPREGDNPTDITRRSNLGAIDCASVARKYR